MSLESPFDNEIVGPQIQPISSFIICKCGCGQLATELTVNRTIRQYIQGHYEYTEEELKQKSEHMSKLLLNHPHWITPDAQARAQKSMKQRYITNPEYVERQSKARKGKKFTQEHKQKKSESAKLTYDRGDRKGWQGKIDMSNIKCSLCGSDKTYILKRNGRPDWRYIDKKRACTRCARREWQIRRGKQWYQEQGKFNQRTSQNRWSKENKHLVRLHKLKWYRKKHNTPPERYRV